MFSFADRLFVDLRIKFVGFPCSYTPRQFDYNAVFGCYFAFLFRFLLLVFALVIFFMHKLMRSSKEKKKIVVQIKETPFVINFK